VYGHERNFSLIGFVVAVGIGEQGNVDEEVAETTVKFRTILSALGVDP
jgi:hypothetical protein